MWKKVDRMLKESDYETTYAYLDNVRRQIGKAYEGKGVFKDAADYELGEVYGALSEDQFRIARSFGQDKDLALANKITQKKKQLQQRMVAVFGKDLAGGLGTQLSTAVSSAVKGDLGKWRRVMNNVPVGQRPEVAGAAFKFFLTGGKNRLTRSFVERYELLAQNKTAQTEMFKHLPDHVVRRVDDLYLVAKGIYRSLDQRNNSKTARDLIVNMDLDKGFVHKLNRHAAVQAGNAVQGGLGSAIGLFSPKPKVFSEEAEAMLRSPRFRQMMESGIRDKGLQNAEKALAATKAYTNWLSVQDSAIQDAVAGQGVFRYLMGEHEINRTVNPM